MIMKWLSLIWSFIARLPSGLSRALAALRERWSSRRFRLCVYVVAGLASAAVVTWSAVHRVREGEVGVIVNNLNGAVGVDDRVGYHFVVPWVQTFHRLDRRVQGLTMAERSGQGFGGGDAVRIKTSDGSNVSLDIQVTFRLVADKAGVVLRTAGPGLAFRDLWVRSAVRSAAAEQFGHLTTEQVYNAKMRADQAREVVQTLNRRLLGYGVEIVEVVAQDFRFYKEYEAIIKKKKLADQEVEEERAKARLALQEQYKQVAAATFSAQAKVATARGEAERTKAAADGYVQRTRIEAEGKLVTAEKKAEGLLAVGLAEAKGLALRAAAMGGGNGINLVALEYARRLGNIKFTGVPVLQDGRIGQYRIHSVPKGASASCAGGTCAMGGVR